MIRSLIQIEDGEVQDFQEAFGFIYADADERFAPDEKADAVSSYVGEGGEHRDGRTTYAPFDYTATFIVEAPNKDLANVNTKINKFNRAVRNAFSFSGVLSRKEITFYNLLNRVKIVGTCDPIAVAEKCYRSNRHGELDCAMVKLNIRVSDPSKCDFELNTDNLPTTD